jgi:hypothetical protein
MIEGISPGWTELDSAIVQTFQEECAQMQGRLPSAEPDRA